MATNSQEKLAGILRLDTARLAKDIEAANKMLVNIGNVSNIGASITRKISQAVVSGVEMGIKSANAKGIELKVKMVSDATTTGRGAVKAAATQDGNQESSDVIRTLTATTTAYNGAGNELITTLRGITEAGQQVRATLDDTGKVASYSITSISDKSQQAKQALQDLRAKVTEMKSAYTDFLQGAQSKSTSEEQLQQLAARVEKVKLEFQQLAKDSTGFSALGLEAQKFHQVIEQGNSVLDTYRHKIQQVGDRSANDQRKQQEQEIQELYRNEVHLINELAALQMKAATSNGEQKAKAEELVKKKQEELATAQAATQEYLKQHTAIQGSKAATDGAAASTKASADAADRLALAEAKAADDAKRLADRAGQVAPTISNATSLVGKLSAAFGTLGNTIQTSIVFSLTSMITRMVVQMPINAIKSFWNSAWEYATTYYDKLNEIQIVTGKTGEQARALGDGFRQLATDMSVSSNEIVEAATVFYRQGLGDDAVTTRLQATIEYSKTAGIEMATAANMITSVVNSIGKDARGVEMTAERVADVFLYLGRHNCPIAA